MMPPGWRRGSSRPAGGDAAAVVASPVPALGLDPGVVQRTLPPGLTVDTCNGRAWIGLVPFFMRGVRPVFCPPLPGISDFLELNVRTYVIDAQGRPGVWFYSLDVNQRLAVELARAWFHLPYQHAIMSARVGAGGGLIIARGGKMKRTRAAFATGDPGRLGMHRGIAGVFLVERYRCLRMTPNTGGCLRVAWRHAPYRVSVAEAPVWDDVMLRLAGFNPADRKLRGTAPDHICTAGPVDVEVFAPRRMEERARVFETERERIGGGALPA